MMQKMLSNSYLYGANAPFIEELYEAYLRNPNSVSCAWREYFEQVKGTAQEVSHTLIRQAFVELAKRHGNGQAAAAPAPAIAAAEKKQVSVLQLINAHRFLGARHADLDPLKRQEKPYIPEL
ncbi:MAG: 2-oxoglutarate dehydrogenase E1 subunit family protein, partial [Burkholderiales bacterium]